MKALIDKLTCRLYNHGISFNGLTQPFELKGLLYYPEYRYGYLARFKAEINNMILLLYPERIDLVNSPHKYYHDNNSGDYTLSEFYRTIEEINERTGFDWWKSELKKIEYGCNVDESQIDNMLKTLVSYKATPYFPMMAKGKTYGSSCQMDMYKVKGYNKSLEVKMHDKIHLPAQTLRWEISVGNMRYLQNRKQPINIYKLEDLVNIQNMQSLAKDLTQKFKNSLKRPMVNLEVLTLSQKRIMACMANPDISASIRKHNKETWRKDLRIFKSIPNTSKEVYDRIEFAIEQKCQTLINS